MEFDTEDQVLLCLMVKNIHDSYETVSNIFGPYFRDLLLNIWEIYEKCSNSVNFWAWKMFFFLKWVRISPEIDWYHYQGAQSDIKLVQRPLQGEVPHQSPVWEGGGQKSLSIQEPSYPMP